MASLTSQIYSLSAPRSLHLKEEMLDTESSDIIAETIYSAISPGTETGAYMGLSALREGIQYPRVLGYCNVAKIIHVGKNISKVKLGDIIFTFQSHRTLFKCQESDFFIKLNNGNIKHFATSYLYHLGYHSLLTANAKQGHNIGIIGAGVLGYTTAVMSSISGAKTFMFSNQQKVKEKLESKTIYCFKKDQSVIDSINSMTHGTGLDIIINTSNTWSDWLFALKLVNKGGIIVNLGFPGRGEPAPDFNPLDPKFVYMKNITIKSLSHISEKDFAFYEYRFNMKRNMEYIIDLINSNKINPDEIITSEINFEKLKEQYERYTCRDSHMLSTIIKWKN